MRTWVLSTLMCIPHFAIYIAQCTVKYELACNGRSWVEQSSNSFVPSTTLSCCSPLRAYCLDLMLLNRIVLRTYCVLSFVVCMFVSVRLCMYACLCVCMCICVHDPKGPHVFHAPSRGHTGAVSRSAQTDETRLSTANCQVKFTHVFAISESNISLGRDPTWKLV